MKTRKIIFIISSVLPLILFSCGKKGSPMPVPAGNTISINGKAYGTVTIGNQIWTTTNYTGPGGGLLYANTTDSATYGNYYNSADITLPAGWRVPNEYDYDKLLGNYSSNDDGNGNVICNLDLTEGLLAKTGWQGISGTNSSGFNAYPAGYLNYLELTRKAYAQGANTTACFLTATNIAYTDYVAGALSDGNVVLQISTAANTYNFYTYYTGIFSLPDDPLDITAYASLRFVRDK